MSAMSTPSTPSRARRPSSLAFSDQTPRTVSSSGISTSEKGKVKLLKELLTQELKDDIEVDVPNFFKHYFKDIDGLDEAVDTFMEEHSGQESLPEFPNDTKESHVLPWFRSICERVASWAEGGGRPPKAALVVDPTRVGQGAEASLKMDLGFRARHRDGEADGDEAGAAHYKDIHFPGEAKQHDSAHGMHAMFDLAKYVREVYYHQQHRLFVLGFTISGRKLRVWAFDRLGVQGSEAMDLKASPRHAVYMILGFMWSTKAQVGHDPKIREDDDGRYIMIERESQLERIDITGPLFRRRCIRGRATTCFRGHLHNDPNATVVIKESWQHDERPSEGDMVKQLTEEGVVNLARYYHHETLESVRRDIRGHQTGVKFKPKSSQQPVFDTPEQTVSRGNGKKRKLSQMEAESASGTKDGSLFPSPQDLSNRQRQRLVLLDDGDPIYKAPTLRKLLSALIDCIKGHQDCWNKGYLHRDISLHNLFFNEKKGFLIDFDLAVERSREQPSGAAGITGTWDFMAIDVLEKRTHGFAQDLESFFWVLYWICIHYDEGAAATSKVPAQPWPKGSARDLSTHKKGIINSETEDFRRQCMEVFTPHFRQLAQCVDDFRCVMFPQRLTWGDKATEGLYADVIKALQKGKDRLEREGSDADASAY